MAKEETGANIGYEAKLWLMADKNSMEVWILENTSTLCLVSSS